MGCRFYPEDAFAFNLLGANSQAMVQVKFVTRRILESRAALIPYVFVTNNVLQRLIDHLNIFMRNMIQKSDMILCRSCHDYQR